MAASSSHRLPLLCPAFPIHSQKCNVWFPQKSPVLLGGVVFGGAEHSGILVHGGRWLYTRLQCSDQGLAMGGTPRPSLGAAHTHKPRILCRTCVPGSSHLSLQGMAAGRRQSGCGRAALSCPGGPCGSQSVG